MAIKRGSKVDSAFSTASMTDIVFLLLMFMLIATTMINPNALRLTLPQSNNKLTDKPLVSISITADLRYFVDGSQTELHELEGILKEKLDGHQAPSVSLFTDETVPIGEVTKVMNIAQRNGYKLALATRAER